MVGTALTAINILNERPDEFIGEIQRKTKHFRSAMTAAGFTILGKEHPISPVFLGEEKIAQEMASRMLDEGIYVIAFSFPVVAKGKARIRVQISAAHSDEQIDKTIAAFTKCGKDMGIIE